MRSVPVETDYSVRYFDDERIVLHLSSYLAKIGNLDVTYWIMASVADAAKDDWVFSFIPGDFGAEP